LPFGHLPADFVLLVRIMRVLLGKIAENQAT
jgi:hypothetical protein